MRKSALHELPMLTPTPFQKRGKKERKGVPEKEHDEIGQNHLICPLELYTSISRWSGS